MTDSNRRVGVLPAERSWSATSRDLTYPGTPLSWSVLVLPPKCPSYVGDMEISDARRKLFEAQAALSSVDERSADLRAKVEALRADMPTTLETLLWERVDLQQDSIDLLRQQLLEISLVIVDLFEHVTSALPAPPDPNA